VHLEKKEEKVPTLEGGLNVSKHRYYFGKYE
jgi:hypothetical protein